MPARGAEVLRMAQIGVNWEAEQFVSCARRRGSCARHNAEMEEVGFVLLAARGAGRQARGAKVVMQSCAWRSRFDKMESINRRLISWCKGSKILGRNTIVNLRF
ncbi:hypothetical protein A2U01_0061160 [Trifolium medium]|uniref:Uncharacterized protein n=1 Tax=Trifolium medium TaxID=97028 RepID=A0A392RTG2_9FABA|nr:hypothetical protein [Trifolium medium]